MYLRHRFCLLFGINVVPSTFNNRMYPILSHPLLPYSPIFLESNLDLKSLLEFLFFDKDVPFLKISKEIIRNSDKDLGTTQPSHKLAHILFTTPL